MQNLRTRFELVAGQMPRPELLHTPIPYTVQGSWELEKSVRYEILYETEPGSPVRAYLFLPKVIKGKIPAVICPHPTNGEWGGAGPAGFGGPVSRFYAYELAERGNYAVLAPDICYYGARKDDPYAIGYASGTMKTIFDHMRGVDLLTSLDFVDGDRIGCIGHSLGGHNSIFAAYYDERIKAAVSSCGLCTFDAYVKTNAAGMAAWAQDCYMPRVRDVFGNDVTKMPWDFPELAASLAPRCAVMINTALLDMNINYPGSKPVIDACRDAYEAAGVPYKFLSVTTNTDHDFPAYSREIGYAFLEMQLGF